MSASNSKHRKPEPMWVQLGFLVVCLFSLANGLVSAVLPTWLRVVLVVGSVVFGGWTILSMVKDRARA